MLKFKSLITFFVVILFSQITVAQKTEFEKRFTKEELAETSPKIREMVEYLRSNAHKDSSNKIEELATRLRYLRHGRKKTEFDRIISSELAEIYQHRIQEIPNYLDHFRQIIEEEYDATQEIRSSKPVEDWRIRTPKSRIAFSDLSNLHTPEAVRLLSEFLKQDEGAFAMRRESLEGNPFAFVHEHYMCPAGYAARSLQRMPFVNSVTSAREEFASNDYIKWPQKYIAEWQDWWQEIEDGKRTFRFKGENIEYGATGEGRLIESAKPRLPHSTKQAADTSKGQKGSMLDFWWIGILILVVGGAYALVRNLRSA